MSRNYGCEDKQAFAIVSQFYTWNIQTRSKIEVDVQGLPQQKS